MVHVCCSDLARDTAHVMRGVSEEKYCRASDLCKARICEQAHRPVALHLGEHCHQRHKCGIEQVSRASYSPMRPGK